MKDVKKVVAQLLKNGAKEYNNVVVKSASVVSLDSYDAVRLTLNQPVVGMVRKEVDGVDVYERGETNVIWSSVYSINATLANDAATATARKSIISLDENGRITDDGSILSDFLTYATIDFVQEAVYAGNDADGNPIMYANPFSDNAEPREVEHDSYYTHVIGIVPGYDGESILEAIDEARRDAIKERAKARFAARANSKQATRSRRSRIDAIETDDAEADDANA